MIEILLLLGVVALAAMFSIRNKLAGSYRLLSWMRRRLSLLKGRAQKAVSEKEQISKPCESSKYSKRDLVQGNTTDSGKIILLHNCTVVPL